MSGIRDIGSDCFHPLWMQNLPQMTKFGGHLISFRSGTGIAAILCGDKLALNMILKEKDSIDTRFARMERALSLQASLHERQRLERDLAWQRAGLKGEMEAAYHIDFHLKNSPNWAVIHDIRFECNGRVAQIDHLLINRLMEIFVVESKSFQTKVRHANGGWERFNRGKWEGIASPVEQNERHIAVLKDVIKERQLAPTWLGMSLPPKFFNIVVVLPSCSIIGTYPEDVRIYRMDTLMSRIRAEPLSPLYLLKMISEEALLALGADLLACHRPRLNSEKPMRDFKFLCESKVVSAKPAQICQSCGGSLSAAESNYCRGRRSRFGGLLLCRKCQAYAPV